ncbi:UPF0481 protein At3g47200-like [Eucalyptus grandis]|uniref:UPF0481 protein At3g47200-like n=1 Tax=Eucalyptus grandis TaxID=71139 RepID=UPI00192EAA75|nr:UPF0481 protein At3g47200-like [Eucalyptus grandis]
MQWIFTFMIRDVLQIESQIPFFVLQEVFDLAKGNTAEEAAKGSLSELALRFFNFTADRPEEHLKKFNGLPNVKHLLDFFRLSFIGQKMEQTRHVDDEHFQLIPSAKQLLLSGIKFKQREGSKSNLIEIQFDHGLLSEKRIIANYLGSSAEVANFFNDLNKDIAFDSSTSYLAELFGQVNGYHKKKWHVRWAGIKHEYFGSPWTFISAVAAFVLLVLTILQVFYAVYRYHRPRK